MTKITNNPQEPKLTADEANLLKNMLKNAEERFGPLEKKKRSRNEQKAQEKAAKIKEEKLLKKMLERSEKDSGTD